MLLCFRENCLFKVKQSQRCWGPWEDDVTQNQRKGQPGEGNLYSLRSGAAASGQPSPVHRDAEMALEGSFLHGRCGKQPLPSISRPFALISLNLQAVRLGHSTEETSKPSRELGLCHHDARPSIHPPCNRDIKNISK